MTPTLNIFLILTREVSGSLSKGVDED